ncbi:rod-determining factor RdfA [Halomarina pelagica]|uniref:rod-determining factor RdfA n=1 Tax=Halomarina pelagica TaxID=2961599 RepID=UPI0020C214EA|nr:rod-determining factor RdfA [Halomarina sp. BND7]
MCKVERIIEKHGLSDLDEELRRRHRGGASLRDLEAFVNRRVLDRVLLETGVALIGDTESIYRVLDGDDASAGQRAEIRSQLERAGPPASEVEDDFVSHQTVKRHLQNCLGVETKRRSRITLDDAEGTVEWAQSRNVSVIENTIERLHNAGLIEADHVDVTQSVWVTCDRTGETFRLRDFLRRGGCDCTDSDGDGGATGG